MRYASILFVVILIFIAIVFTIVFLILRKQEKLSGTDTGVLPLPPKPTLEPIPQVNVRNFMKFAERTITNLNLYDFEKELDVEFRKLLQDECSITWNGEHKELQSNRVKVTFDPWYTGDGYHMRFVVLTVLEQELHPGRYHFTYIQQYNKEDLVCFLVSEKNIEDCFRQFKVDHGKLYAVTFNYVSPSTDKTYQGLYQNLYVYNKDERNWDMATKYGERIYGAIREPALIHVVPVENGFHIYLNHKQPDEDRIYIQWVEGKLQILNAPKKHRVQTTGPTGYGLLLGLSSGQFKTLWIHKDGMYLICDERNNELFHVWGQNCYQVRQKRNYMAKKQSRIPDEFDVPHQYSDMVYYHYLLSSKNGMGESEALFSKNLCHSDDLGMVDDVEEVHYIANEFISFGKYRYWRDGNQKRYRIPQLFFCELDSLNQWQRETREDYLFWNYTVKNSQKNAIEQEYNYHGRIYEQRELEFKRQFQRTHPFVKLHYPKYYVSKDNFILQHMQGKVRLVLPVFVSDEPYTGNVHVQMGEKLVFRNVLPEEITGHDHLCVDFQYIRQNIPGAIDAVSSPDQNTLIVLARHMLYVYIKDGNFHWQKPVLSIPVGKNSAIVQKNWIPQENVEQITQQMQRYAGYGTNYQYQIVNG